MVKKKIFIRSLKACRKAGFQIAQRISFLLSGFSHLSSMALFAGQNQLNLQFAEICGQAFIQA